MELNRRQFITAGAAAILAGGAKESYAQDKKSDLARIFEGTTVTDQDGKSLNLPALMENKPCIVAFGYNGCPLCQEITDTISAVANDPSIMKENVPVVIITVTPEKDKNQAREYVKRYGTKKIEEYGLGEKNPSNRKLHLAFASSNDEAMKIQKKLAELFGKENTLVEGNQKKHLKELSLFNDGDIVRVNGKPVAPAGITLVGNFLKSNDDLQNAAIKSINEGLNAISASRSK